MNLFLGTLGLNFHLCNNVRACVQEIEERLETKGAYKDPIVTTCCRGLSQISIAFRNRVLPSPVGPTIRDVLVCRFQAPW
jgi:hypothetical protein